MTMGDLPHWDLSNVFPGLESEAFEQATVELGSQVEDIESYMVNHSMASDGEVPGTATGVA